MREKCNKQQKKNKKGRKEQWEHFTITLNLRSKALNLRSKTLQ